MAGTLRLRFCKKEGEFVPYSRNRARRDHLKKKHGIPYPNPWDDDAKRLFFRGPESEKEYQVDDQSFQEWKGVTQGSRFIDSFMKSVRTKGAEFEQLGPAGIYQFGSKVIWFDYSAEDKRRPGGFFHGTSKRAFDSHYARYNGSFFIVFLLGFPKTIESIVISAERFNGMLKNVETDQKRGEWKYHIHRKGDRYVLRTTGGAEHDLTDGLDRYDLLGLSDQEEQAIRNSLLSPRGPNQLSPEMLDELVAKFDRDGSERAKVEAARALSAEFRERFPFVTRPESIDLLTAKNVFNPGHESFFYWVEHRLSALGRISVYARWYVAARANLRIFKQLLRESLANGVDMKRRIDAPWEQITYFGLDKTVAKKIVSLYYPRETIPIFKTSDLVYFADRLGLDVETLAARKYNEEFQNLSVGAKFELLNDALLTAKNSHPALGDWDNALFMQFLYSNLPPPDRAQDEETMDSRGSDEPQVEPAMTDTPPIITLEKLAEVTFLPRERVTKLEQILLERRQIILYGPPATGKTFVAKKLSEYITSEGGSYKIVQFHPSYGYEDFVEGIRPAVEGGLMAYQVADGMLKELSNEARRNPGNRYVLIIDEINRGNIAKILGELIYCLEYRGENVQLPYSRQLFSLPNNLYLIGTMNSADRSIALVDYALRRRFAFFDFMPDQAVLSMWLDSKEVSVDKQGLLQFFLELNERISNQNRLGREFQVGHSYFMVDNLDKERLANVWNFSILPLLREYYFEEPEEIEHLDQLFKTRFP